MPSGRPVAALLIVACMLVGAWALNGCKPKSASGPADPSKPYVDTWRMPTSGATWVLNADGTCSINGKPGTYTEANGIIQLSGAASYSVNWQVSEDGKHLSVSRPGKSGRSYVAQFQRQ